MKDLDLPRGDDAVLLVHGLCSSPLELQYLGKQLHKAGFAVHIPYLRGYGAPSASDPVPVSRWEHWRYLVLEHFDDLSKRYRSVSVCGLCIGADLALSAAAARPGKVAALALLSTTLFYDGWNTSRFRALLPLAYYTPLRVFYPRHRERPPYGLKNERLRAWVANEMDGRGISSVGAASIPIAWIFQAERLIKHVKCALPLVTAPTLLVHANDDDVASTRSPDFVADRVASSRVEQVRLSDSYHMITVDNQKQLVAEHTIRFIRDVLDRSDRAEPRGTEHSYAGRSQLVT